MKLRQRLNLERFGAQGWITEDVVMDMHDDVFCVVEINPDYPGLFLLEWFDGRWELSNQRPDSWN